MTHADAVVRRMTDALAHRGPDDSGVWIDREAGVALGHRRLAVVDLSPAGHQPMLSASKRTVMVYNGEVYNHRELRVELEARGLRFRGTSDTEVILEGCEVWGVEALARRLIGMFAFAVWDRERRVLTIVRDRLGIKPMYVGSAGNAFVFASELKAFEACPGFRGEIDRASLAAFVRHNYLPEPHTIYCGVRRIPPGSTLTIAAGRDPVASVFWSMTDVARSGLARRDDALSDEDAEAQLDTLLRDAVARRMIADVPLGAFLSGGIDSSLVVALMQAQSDRPVRTFTIGFDAKAHNEADHARAVARHLGTDHTELYVEPSHVLEVVPHLPRIFDQPFADSSQIPTYLISRLTRQHVTVALSGDGGDELFAGYQRYARVAEAWQRVSAVPAPLRRVGGAVADALPAATWDAARRVLPARRVGQLQRVAAGARNGFAEFYRQSVSYWPRPDRIVPGATEASAAYAAALSDALALSPTEQMQWIDTVTYLPSDILTKVDRASMAVSLEARVPLLDHRVVEFSWTLPRRLLVRDGQTKWLPRRVLSRYVPDTLVERPKMGFGVPLCEWLRGPLRSWAGDLLGGDALRRDGLLEHRIVSALWSDHLAARADWAEQLWGLLMFQAWRVERLSAAARA